VPHFRDIRILAKKGRLYKEQPVNSQNYQDFYLVKRLVRKMKGTVKFYNEGKNFGFIAGEDGKEYFVHLSGIKEGVALKEGDAVVFEVEQGDRGPKAVNVVMDTAGAEEATEEASEEATEEEAPAEEETKEE
jgi:CspA family cold shock protein